MAKIHCPCGHEFKIEEYPGSCAFAIFSEKWIDAIHNELLQVHRSSAPGAEFSSTIMRVLLHHKPALPRGFECPICGRLLMYRDWTFQASYIPERLGDGLPMALPTLFPELPDSIPENDQQKQ